MSFLSNQLLKAYASSPGAAGGSPGAPPRTPTRAAQGRTSGNALPSPLSDSAAASLQPLQAPVAPGGAVSPREALVLAMHSLPGVSETQILLANGTGPDNMDAEQAEGPPSYILELLQQQAQPNSRGAEGNGAHSGARGVARPVDLLKTLGLGLPAEGGSSLEQAAARSTASGDDAGVASPPHASLLGGAPPSQPRLPCAAAVALPRSTAPHEAMHASNAQAPVAPALAPAGGGAVPASGAAAARASADGWSEEDAEEGACPCWHEVCISRLNDVLGQQVLLVVQVRGSAYSRAGQGCALGMPQMLTYQTPHRAAAICRILQLSLWCHDARAALVQDAAVCAVRGGEG